MASDESIEAEAFSLIVMEDVSDRFQQSCSMDRPQALALMEALATLHSHYWGKVDHRERGSFWTMERRKPKKGVSLKGAIQSLLKISRFSSLSVLVFVELIPKLVSAC